MGKYSYGVLSKFKTKYVNWKKYYFIKKSYLPLDRLVEIKWKQIISIMFFFKKTVTIKIKP